MVSVFANLSALYKFLDCGDIRYGRYLLQTKTASQCSKPCWIPHAGFLDRLRIELRMVGQLVEAGLMARDALKVGC